MFLQNRFPSTPGPTLSPSPLPTVRQGGFPLQFLLPFQDSLGAHPQRRGHRPYPSPSPRQRLVGGPQPSGSFSQMRFQTVILLSQGSFPFLPHLPVQPPPFLLATSPIVLGHGLGPPFCRISHHALS